MNVFIKNTTTFLLISFVTAIIFTIALKINGYAGQMIGMAPIYILIISAIAIIISLVLIYVLKDLFEMIFLKNTIIFTIVYLITIFAYNDCTLFTNDINTWSYLSAIISLGIFQLYHLINKNFA